MDEVGGSAIVAMTRWYRLAIFWAFSCCVAGSARAQPGMDGAALQSMASLESALTLCAMDTGYYVALEALNDLPFTTTPAYDYINNGGGCYVIRPETGRFEAGRVDLVNRFLAWDGPYINYQPGTTQETSLPYDQGSPLDPWGNPYYLFTPMGMVRGDAGAITQELYGDAFDRYAIVSLGPDGEQSGDDLVRLFGSGVTVFSVSSIRGFYASWSEGEFKTRSGADLTIRGYRLGAQPNGGQVYWGATELTAIKSWSDTAIELTLPLDLEGQDGLKVVRGAAMTNSLILDVTRVTNGAQAWVLYQ